MGTDNESAEDLELSCLKLLFHAESGRLAERHGDVQVSKRRFEDALSEVEEQRKVLSEFREKSELSSEKRQTVKRLERILDAEEESLRRKLKQYS